MPEPEEKIIYGSPVEPKWTNISLGVHMWSNIQKHGNKTALIDSNTKEQMSYSELFLKSQQLASVLTKYGVTEKNIVGICSENSILYPLAVLASLYVGATVAPFSASYTVNELKHVVSLSNPKLFFCSDSTCDKIKEILPHTQIIVMNISNFNSLLDKETTSFIPCKIKNTEDHIALLLCSSGTTGLPKGVMLSDSNVLSVTYIVEASGYFPLIPDNNTQIGLLPFYHTYGLNVLLRWLAKGFTIVVMSKFDPKTFLQNLQEYKAKTCSIPSPLMAFLAKHPIVDNYDLSNLIYVTCGAAPLGREIEEMFKQRFPSVREIVQGYGLTEATITVTQNPVNRCRLGSCGKIIPGIEIKIVDLKTGETLGPMLRGELCIRGPTIMKGYIGDDKATRETIDSEGWLHTGDVAYYDFDEYFFIVDRIKELIKYKGYQVPPAELESVLRKHPNVQDVAVIGVPDENVGELPKAYVVKNGEVTAKELFTYVQKNVSPAKWLRGGIEFVNEIPRGPTGKILRRKIKNRIISKL